MILNKLSASTIVMALVSILSWTPAEAQDTTIRTKKQAELIVPRPAFQPVQSMDGTNADATMAVSRYAEVIGSTTRAKDIHTGRYYDLSKDLQLKPRQTLVLAY